MRCLHIPANHWRPAQLIDLPTSDADPGEISFAALRTVIDCRMVEVIKYLDLPQFPDASFVAFGDEEGRYANPIEPNLRATQLLEFPYLLVGDIVIVGRSTHMSDCDVPEHMLLTLQQPPVPTTR